MSRPLPPTEGFLTIANVATLGELTAHVKFRKVVFGVVEDLVCPDVVKMAPGIFAA